MPSFTHKRLINRIACIDEIPVDLGQYGNWIKAGHHLPLLRDNADEDELIVYACGPYTFIHAVVVCADKLCPIDQSDLLGWSCNPYRSVASYVSGGRREGVWLETGMRHVGAETLENGKQLVFGRSFEGLKEDDANYFEILQEYTHLTGIHWRPAQRAYCRFDERGDFDPIVSITSREGKQGVTLVSFKREPLENYLAVSNSRLVRMFDFTLLRFDGFVGWPDGPEEICQEGEEFFYRQKILAGSAGYTRGVQIVNLSRTRGATLSAMKAELFGQRGRQYVEFIAHDWRNKRLTRISTDPAATTNYFEAARNSLLFDTSPAFLRPDVLVKYKSDHDKYTIESREINCRGAWILRNYDVNEAGQIHTYICYLRDLPYEEQLYWASYNEPPKAPISKRAFTTDFEGEVYPHPDPLQEVLSIAQRWAEQRAFWWTLRDNALLERVTIPRTTSRDEWAEAFMDLSKLIVEGFELKAIRAKLVEAGVLFGEKDQSLVLIEKLLAGDPTNSGNEKLGGLRTVQQIRSKAKGHAGGRQSAELAQDALKRHETFAAHFEHVCGLVAAELERIERLFL
jgi:hypothetical protein